jgi:hypothetical protein
MPEAATDRFTVKVVRYDVTRWTIAQSAVPFAMLSGVAARRIPNTLTVTAPLGLLALAFFLFFRAQQNLGAQTLLREGGRLRLQGSEEELSHRTAGRWTLRGNVARLHGSRLSYKLRLVEGDPAAFEQALASVLGTATATARRGSPRARGIAAAVLILGLVALTLAIVLQNLPLLAVGILAGIGGGATFGALSQRVIRS